MALGYCNPVYAGYFADPFVLATGAGEGPAYVAYGTGSVVDGRVFEVLVSDDLVRWRRAGGALVPLPAAAGSDYWAPEVIGDDGRWWMYYSLGVGDVGHTLRVAVADSPLGPFSDVGVDLTPSERFAIDPSPFRDIDGTVYLFYARDDLDGDRVGTMLAVDVLESMTALRGQPRTVLRPSADWQLFRRGRSMYGAVYDWHTLEGPFVVRRAGRYWCLYSGGSWETSSYAVSYAVADSPLGPWAEPPDGDACSPPCRNTCSVRDTTASWPGRPGETSWCTTHGTPSGPHGGYASTPWSGPRTGRTCWGPPGTPLDSRTTEP